MLVGVNVMKKFSEEVPLCLSDLDGRKIQKSKA